MKNDVHAHRADTLQEIGGWVTRYRSSGLGLGVFAKRHGLPRSRLHYWVYDKRYAQLGRRSAAPPVFQELKLAAGLAVSNWAVEISLPAGPVVRFSAGATPVLMSAVVEALRGPC
jgi:hypothetical protein